MSRSQAGIPVRWPTWGIDGKDRSTGSVQRILIRGVKSVISPDLRTILRLGVGSGGPLPRGELLEVRWGTKEQKV